MGIKSISLAATALVLSTSVNASLVSVDLNTAGDGLLTHDTVSGLNWLDLTQTKGFSYNFVSSELGSAGLYDGYRYATNDEVVNLFLDNYSIDLSSGGIISEAGVDPDILSAAELFGNIANIFSADYNGFLGYTDDSPSEGRQTRIGLLTCDVCTGFESTYTAVGTDYSQSSGHSYTGSYLVQVSTVPVPAAAWLFGSGLIGLVGIARRKSA